MISHTSLVCRLFLLFILSIVSCGCAFGYQTDGLRQPLTPKILESRHQKGEGYAKFIPGYCTDYAAWRRPDIFPSADGSDRLFGGNALQWYVNARKIGIRTGKFPQTGAVIVFADNYGATTSNGHVGIVEKILNDHMIEITDMNYLGRNIVTRRIVDSRKAIGYIYKNIMNNSFTLQETIEKQKNIFLTISLSIDSLDVTELGGVDSRQSFFVPSKKITSLPQDLENSFSKNAYNDSSFDQIILGGNKKKMIILDKRKKLLTHFLSQKMPYDLIHQSIIISMGLGIIRLESPSLLV